jgi:hypothetical protein
MNGVVCRVLARRPAAISTRLLACSPYKMSNIRLIAQARNPIQVSVAKNPNVTSSVANVRPRSAFAAVDAPAALWMIFDPSLAPVAIVVALTSSCFTFSAPLALLPDLFLPLLKKSVDWLS